MFAIAVDLLALRYTAMQFNDRSHPEWPPHPARLFSAMTAAWADDDEPDPLARIAMAWLEAQPPPTITCSEVRHRAVVTHFVPVNDPTAVKVLPEYRERQGRTYPTVIPDQATFWFTWPDAEPSEEHRVALDRVLARVGRIGHSSTLVSCRCEVSAPAPVWIPEANGASEERVRVPASGLLDRLELAYRSHMGSEPRLLPARMVGYRRPSPTAPSPPTPLLGGDWLVLGVQAPRLPAAARSLDIARATRNALLVFGDQPSPEILSGHIRIGSADDAQTPPLDRPHLAVVPLPNAGHQHSNGSVLGVALILPADCPDADRSAVERAVLGWARAGFELQVPSRSGPPVQYQVTDLGVDRAASSAPRWVDSDLPARRRTTTRGYWCRSARRWLTVTPIALDRFPGKLCSSDPRTRERAESEARDSIARACLFAGLPGDPSVTIRLDAPLTGLPAAPANGKVAAFRSRLYPGYRTGSGTPRVCVHAEIEFAQPVSGPVLIGAGRYLGYGLCLPSDDPEALS